MEQSIVLYRIMTRNEAELKRVWVNDFCKGFAGHVDEELIKALMVLLDSDFTTVEKHVRSKVKSYDTDHDVFSNGSQSYGIENLRWYTSIDRS